MSNGNFEVHPIGTTAELKFLRQLARDLVEREEIFVRPVTIGDLAEKIRTFYEYHNEAHQI